MRNIEHNGDCFKYLCDLIFDIKDNGFDKEKIESILERIMSRDSEGALLIKHNISEKGRYTAIFIPTYESIVVSVVKLNEWLDINTKDLAEMYEIEDMQLLRSYLVLMVLMHEVEHANQYLIGIGKVEAPCIAIKDAYFTLFDLLKRKDYVIPRPVKQVRRAVSVLSYKARENEFLLERNAQFDSLGTLANIALYNEHGDIRRMLLDMRSVFATAGYIKNTDGTLINTFKDIYMGDKIKNIKRDYETMNMMDRYRLGLPVDQCTRERILALRK